jgi:two-component system OmpR family response regulator
VREAELSLANPEARLAFTFPHLVGTSDPLLVKGRWPQMRLLVVEDEKRLATLLHKGLTEERHAVDLAGSGEDGLDWVSVGEYDAIVLDVMLPGIDGLEVCRRLRREAVYTPVLLLTARDAIADRVQGLDAGADDYLVKLVAFVELAARLRALGRRPTDTVPTVLRVGNVTLDPATHKSLAR